MHPRTAFPPIEFMMDFGIVAMGRMKDRMMFISLDKPVRMFSVIVFTAPTNNQLVYSFEHLAINDSTVRIVTMNVGWQAKACCLNWRATLYRSGTVR
jgi:hypothetical protein